MHNMDKVFEVGRVPYAAASTRKEIEIIEKIKLTIGIVVDILKVFVLSIPYYVESFVYLFLSRPKKSVVGKVALITGAGNGIGRCIALRLAREGCNIAVADIDFEAAIRTADEIRNMNAKAIGYQLDIADFAAAEKLRAQIEKELGPVDILVNNAALLPIISLREGTVKEVQRIVDVNITANFIMTRIFLPSMQRQRYGHIVNISSMSAFHPIAGAILYTSSKYALLGFSQALAEEMRLEGYGDCVHITSVHPYYVSTQKDFADRVLKNLRFAPLTPEETANVAIDGVLRNQLQVCIPAFDRWLVFFICLLPYKVQHLFRDHILKEPEYWKTLVDAK